MAEISRKSKIALNARLADVQGAAETTDWSMSKHLAEAIKGTAQGRDLSTAKRLVLEYVAKGYLDQFNHDHAGQSRVGTGDSPYPEPSSLYGGSFSLVHAYAIGAELRRRHKGEEGLTVGWAVDTLAMVERWAEEWRSNFRAETEAVWQTVPTESD